jgi:hypothetical protein
VFFIDANLGTSKLAGILRTDGYKVITHPEWYGVREGVPDPEIIADCGAKKVVLLTADSDLETTWAAEIEVARISVVILTNNTDGADKWGARLIAGHKNLTEHLRKHKKPCAIRFSCDAKASKVRLYGKRRAKVFPV